MPAENPEDSPHDADVHEDTAATDDGEVSHLDSDFSGDHGLTGLDEMHDSVHQSTGLGFEGDQHHT
ncbi:MAG: hypothetical protein QOC92_203 [Acidimicrobiaceae bacterium]